MKVLCIVFVCLILCCLAHERRKRQGGVEITASTNIIDTPLDCPLITQCFPSSVACNNGDGRVSNCFIQNNECCVSYDLCLNQEDQASYIVDYCFDYSLNRVCSIHYIYLTNNTQPQMQYSICWPASELVVIATSESLIKSIVDNNYQLLSCQNWSLCFQNSLSCTVASGKQCHQNTNGYYCASSPVCLDTRSCSAEPALNGLSYTFEFSYVAQFYNNDANTGVGTGVGATTGSQGIVNGASCQNCWYYQLCFLQNVGQTFCSAYLGANNGTETNTGTNIGTGGSIQYTCSGTCLFCFP